MLKDVARWIICLFLVAAIASCQNSTPSVGFAPTQTPPELVIEQTPEIEATTPKPSPTLAVISGAGPSPAPEVTPPSPPADPVPGIELVYISPETLDLAASAGAYWIRRNSLKWSDIEPQEGKRNWAAVENLEKEMLAIAERGSHLILVVSSTPVWAQKVPGSFCGPVAQEKMAAFSQFLFDVVQRYSAPPYRVKYWELGNEPDVENSIVPPDSIFGCWGDKTDIFFGGGTYAEMLKHVYPQIKSADPEAQVLVGGLLLDCDPVSPPEGKDCQSALFMEGILRNGGGDYFDGISFHGYDYYSGGFDYSNLNWHSSWDTTGPAMIAKARYLRSLLAAYQQADKYLLNTESGVLCARNEEQPVCQSEEFNLTKAYYISETMITALAEGIRTNVWYSLTGWRGTGLIDRQGQTLPAFTAYRFTAAELLSAAFLQTWTEVAGVRGFDFQKGEVRLLVLWSIDGKSHEVEFDPLPSAIYNVFGEPITPASKLTISRQPNFIEW